MAEKTLDQIFQTGLNDRIPKDRRSKGFEKLQNARLQERGSTLQVSRIDGYQQISGDSTSFDVVYDSIVYDNDLVVYWYDSSNSEVVITFIDIGGAGTTEKRFSDTQAGYGELTLLEDNIYLTPYDKQLNNIGGTWYLNDFISTTPTFEISTNSTNSTLDDLTYYWYKLRFVYYDGHKTITSYPQFVKTASPAKEVVIDTINVQTDLDGNFADIEVFRKKEGNDWFLIERVTPSSTSYSYTDDGKVNLQSLDERNSVWANDPLTQDIVRDRLVRANLEYFSKELGWDEGDVNFGTSTTTIDLSLPKNTEVEIFGQGRFKDGTLSSHKFLGEISIGSSEVKLTTDPQTQPSNVDELNEVSYYGKYKSKTPSTISFDGLEIYNDNIPSLATKDEAEADQDKPTNPHIFLGWKNVLAVVNSGSSEIHIYDEDWDTSGTTDSTSAEDDNWQSVTAPASLGGDTISITIQGDGSNQLQTLTYKKKYESTSTSIPYDEAYVYELAMLQPLKEAISQGKASVRLNSLYTDEQLSSIRPNTDFIDNEIDVVGLLDTSIPREDFYVDSNDVILPSGKNHVYLILSSDSIYADVNNSLINQDNVLGDYDTNGAPTFDPVFDFELVGLEEKDFGGSTTTSSVSVGTEFEVDYGLIEYSPLQEDGEELLFLGVQKEFDQDNATVYDDYFEGYELFNENLFEYQVLQEASISENIISDENLEQFQEDYPNQLVWGGSYILESNASGTRDFEFTNFKNISQDYGEIVKISYINNVLLVFCERGVNRINIGEVLTQQSGGQVFVDSSRFLNNDQWILKNVPDIKARSVVQYENMLFFCDGKDVWKYTDTLQNISNGKVTLDVDEDFVGAVDPKNKEYQITNGSETWVYSIEIDQWQGPFTYQLETASAYRDNFYGVVGSDSVEFNSGNTFDGSSYDTIIESVANTMDDASVTKLFRKFYLETEGDATFSYGKDYGSWTDKTLSNYPDKNGVVHIGVNPTNKNGRQIYWKFTTQQQDFILQLVSYLAAPRKRR